MQAWTSGEGYEGYIGRWSRLVAARFLTWLDPGPGLSWLDLGCGTGALTSAILESAAPASILGVDPSPAYLAHAREQVTDPRVDFHEGDGLAIPSADAERDVVVSGLALNFMPDPAKALSDMRRTLRPGGQLALYVWDYAGGMQLLRYFFDAAAVVDPASRELEEGRRFAICNPDRLRALFEDCGLTEVDVRPLDIATRFEDFDDYWRPFLGGQGAAPVYVASLSEETRARLADRLREMLPRSPDGAIELVARAWAVKGRR